MCGPPRCSINILEYKNNWWLGRDLNPRPRDYDSPALPLSYRATRGIRHRGLAGKKQEKNAPAIASAFFLITQSLVLRGRSLICGGRSLICGGGGSRSASSRSIGGRSGGIIGEGRSGDEEAESGQQSESLGHGVVP